MENRHIVYFTEAVGLNLYACSAIKEYLVLLYPLVSQLLFQLLTQQSSKLLLRHLSSLLSQQHPP